jgi:tetratricopeptide (TPR) repeat protein
MTRTNPEQTSGRKKIPKYFIKALLLIFSFCVAFIITELFLRLNYVGNGQDIIIEDDPVLHHRWKPSVRYANRLAHLTTNKQSWLEEYDITSGKSPNTYRIFYLGDSQVQGHVGIEDRMVEIVERELNWKYAKGDIYFEVINTGTSSYSCLMYYLLVKTKILNYSPDLVVLNIDMTDVVNDAAYRRFMETDKKGDPVAINPNTRYLITMTPIGYKMVKNPTYSYVPDWLLRHSRLVHFIHVKRRNYLGQKRIKKQKYELNADWLEKEWSKEIQDNVNFSMDILSKTINLLKSRNVKVMVTGVPHYPQYTGKQSAKPHDTLREIAQMNDVPYLNSYLALKNKITGTDVSEYYHADDPTHFNVEGNRIWAQAQLDYLLEPKNELLPERKKQDNAQHSSTRGVDYSEHNQNINNTDYFNNAIYFRPNNAYDFNSRGIEYSKRGMYKKAIDDFNQAIRLKPDLVDAYNNRGLTYFRDGQSQPAINDFNQAIRLKPDLVSAYINRGAAYLTSHKKEPGCLDARKACSLGNCELLKMAKEKGYCR